MYPNLTTLGTMLIQKYERYLPTAFDESLSLLEKVNKVIDYLNKTGIAINDITEFVKVVAETQDLKIDDLRKEFEELDDVIRNGIIPENLRIIINELMADGTLADIINGEIFEDLNDEIALVDSKVSDIVPAYLYGIMADGSDETEKFQRMLNENAGKKIFIPKFVGKLKIGKIIVPDNTFLSIARGAVIEIISGLLDGEKWFEFKDKKSIRFISEGCTFKMLKEEYTTGEHRHCFNLDNSKDIRFEGITAEGSGGDGWYIGSPDAGMTTYCQNIVLENCFAENNRRQGLSISSVDGFRAIDCGFNNTIGTNPQCGVDIEPNSFRNRIKDVKFIRCDAIGNAGRGFDVMLKKIEATTQYVDIQFIDCYTRNNAFGFMPKYGNDGAKGIVEFIRCIAEEDKLSGFEILSHSANGIRLEFILCKAINCNTNGDTSSSTSFAASYNMAGSTSEPRLSLGNVLFDRCKSIETRITPKIRRGFASSLVENNVPTNVLYKDCESIGHSISEFEHATDYKNVRVIEAIKRVKTFTQSDSITSRYTGQIINNAGAPNIVSLTLPVAKEGMEFEFMTENTQVFKLNPASNSKIMGMGVGTGASIQTVTEGSSITLVGRADGKWNVKNIVGVWVAS